MPDLSQLTMPSGNTYDLKDAEARRLIAELQAYTDYLGVTTSDITDGSTINPVMIGEEPVTAVKGNIVNKGNAEFIFNGTKWQEFGDLGALKALAYKDEASGSYTPAGTVAKPTFTGTQATITSDYTPAGTVEISTGTSTTKNYTPAGTVSKPTFTGTKATVKSAYTPAGTVSQPTFTGTQATITSDYTPAGTVSKPTFTGTQATITSDYTPAGTVSTPTITVTPNTTKGKFITGVGTLPQCELPVLTMTVSGENLTFGWSAGSFNAGTLPTQSSEATLVTGIKSATSTQPTFTGTAGEATASYKPAGTVSQPTFTGTAGEATASYKPAGTVSKPTFSGTAGEATVEYTPAGTVSQPTFTGTGVDLEATFTGTPGEATATYKPAGTNSAPKFTGTAATITVS